MKNTLSAKKSVQVGQQEFLWHIHRQPQWCTAHGWKGLALYVELAHEPQRALILEFPFKIINHRNSPHRQRPQVAEKDVVAAIMSALTAGWNPQSKGKAFVFQVAEMGESG
jgi:hypothetical protein